MDKQREIRTTWASAEQMRQASRATGPGEQLGRPAKHPPQQPVQAYSIATPDGGRPGEGSHVRDDGPGAYADERFARMLAGDDLRRPAAHRQGVAGPSPHYTFDFLRSPAPDAGIGRASPTEAVEVTAASDRPASATAAGWSVAMPATAGPARRWLLSPEL